MSDQKLDLILTVLSNIKLKVDSLETRFDGLEAKVDNLDLEFKGFKNQVIESFAKVQNRFEVLEKQMIAIGVEIKSEIKVEISIVGKQIDRLEEETLHNRTDTVGNRRKIKDFEARLTRLENHVGITV